MLLIAAFFFLSSVIVVLELLTCISLIEGSSQRNALYFVLMGLSVSMPGLTFRLNGRLLVHFTLWYLR